MGESVERPHLPRVNEEDLAAALLEDILDPTHLARWYRYADENPELMREILRRADCLAHEAGTQVDVTGGTVNIVTFVLDALEKSLQRTASDGGDDEALQH